MNGIGRQSFFMIGDFCKRFGKQKSRYDKEKFHTDITFIEKFIVKFNGIAEMVDDDNNGENEFEQVNFAVSGSLAQFYISLQHGGKTFIDFNKESFRINFGLVFERGKQSKVACHNAVLDSGKSSLFKFIGNEPGSLWGKGIMWARLVKKIASDVALQLQIA